MSPFTDDGCKSSPIQPSLRFIRRNGEEVSWDSKKIEKAVGEAFVAQHQNPLPVAQEIAQAVTQRVCTLKVRTIALEQVQDLVQEELMRRGYFKIAEAYILYRSERTKQRQEEKTNDQQEAIFLLRDKNGRSRLWTELDLLPWILFATQELDLPLSPKQIAQRLCHNLQGEMAQKDWEEHLLRQARGLMTVDPGFNFFSAQLQWSFLCSQILDWDPAQEDAAALEKKYREAFPRYIQEAVEAGLLHPEMLAWDLEKLAAALDVSADRQWDCIAMHKLLENYLLCEWETGICWELPQFFWMRIAMGIFLAEASPQREQWVLELYRLFKDRLFCVAPTALRYAGTVRAQMLSTYIYQVQDDLESIMIKGIADNALAVKWGAALSGSWTAVRGSGSPIRGTRQGSGGVMPFLELHQHQLAIARPGGEGSKIYGNASLEIWHADIEAFIDFKHRDAQENSTNGLGTELWIPDIFMKRVRSDEHWTLFRVEETRELLSLYGQNFEECYREFEQEARDGKCWSRTIPAAGLWGKIMARIYETGFPHIAFKDRCNERRMLESTIHSSSVGSEHLLHAEPEASTGCPSGEIILHRHLDAHGNLDLPRLRRTIHLAVRALDAMLDANYFPAQTSEKLTRRYRPLGLGIAGLQDALYQKNLAFDDPQSIAFQDDCLEMFSYYAIEASVDLAQEKGRYECFGQSLWAQGKFPWESHRCPSCCEIKESEHRASLPWETLRGRMKAEGMRNAYLMALSSTRSTARLMACYPGVAPATGHVFSKHFSADEKIAFFSDALVKHLQMAGYWTQEFYEKMRCCGGELTALLPMTEPIRDIFKTAFVLDTESLLQAASVRQKWIDQSQCLDIYLNIANMAALSFLYQRAWEYGLKTIHALKMAPLPSDIYEEIPLPSSLYEAMENLHNGVLHYDF
ncbi:MAG: ribonucleoside-diphosphate reductase subunit alpha [Puniceicoccales bacterium]|jgi:ribonucleoside-diphosphate reductase alpha chain|nr:ribonucleoside-diphosphate reductase subunit alpha [Puniceicoccales bacterium]